MCSYLSWSLLYYDNVSACRARKVEYCLHTCIVLTLVCVHCMCVGLRMLGLKSREFGLRRKTFQSFLCSVFTCMCKHLCYLQTRGSIPLYWSQRPTLKYKPTPCIDSSSKQASRIIFATLIHTHCEQIIVPS